jgi:hypothetical protein
MWNITDIGVGINGNSIVFSRGSIKQMVHRKILERRDPLLKYFNVFQYMPLTNDGKFEVIFLHGSNMVFQAHSGDGCDFTGIDPITSTEDSLTPNSIEAKFELCTSQKLRDLYANALRFARNYNELEIEQLQAAIQAFLDIFLESLLDSYDFLSTAAGVYGNTALPTTDFYNATRDRDAFNKQMVTSTAVGYMQKILLDFNAAPIAKKHYNVYVTGTTPVISAADIDADYRVTTSIKDIYSRLKKGATREMVTAINRGVTVVNNERLFPMMIVDNYTHDRVVEEYELSGDMAAKENAPVKREKIPLEVGGQMVNFFYYTVYGLPIVPDPNITAADLVIKRKTYFAAITMSQVIAIGNSFGKLGKQDESSDFPMRFELETRLKEENKLYAKTEGLQATYINHDRLIVASQFIVAVP